MKKGEKDRRGSCRFNFGGLRSSAHRTDDGTDRTENKMKSKLKKQYIIPAVIGGAILLTLIRRIK